jgi:hypothetical protein
VLDIQFLAWPNATHARNKAVKAKISALQVSNVNLNIHLPKP